MDVDKEPGEIDEGLYSRQLYVIGAEAMKKMNATSVLLCGLTGVGVEIAKNLILTGIGTLAINDNSNVTWNDLSSNFYASERDVGKNRVEVVLPHLTELNKYVNVKHQPGELNQSVLSNFQVVVLVDHPTTKMGDVAQFCHEKGIKLVAVESRGVSGCIFCDFGPNFVVTDVDGEEPVTCLITAITNANPAAVTVHEEQRHNLEDGGKVHLTDVQGLPEINDKTFTVKVTGPFEFTIDCDTSNMPHYQRGGYCKTLKPGATLQFKSLPQAIAEPEFLITDFAKMDKPAQLHVLYQALHRWIVGHENRNPTPYDAAQAGEILNIAREIAGQSVELDAEYLTKLINTFGGAINPMAAFFGGVAAQEVLKACSGKHTPIKQWLYFDAIEVLPKQLPTAQDAAPANCRYDGQIAVFGKKFQETITRQRNFVIGAGALGCEFLKNFAMMGWGCSEQGSIVVTDMDNIEKSNLSRQFLFRANHIGMMKSEVAAAAARAMNPAFNVRFMSDKVAPESEHVFDDDFWEQIDGVTNALDNVVARLFVDGKCIYYRKPLLESGTLGTKGNVQVVVPRRTESYGSSRDPPEKSIPICTLKNFPNAIEHCIQWARDAFEGLFRQNAEDVNNYLTKQDFIETLDKEPGTKIPTLDGIYDSLVQNKPTSYEQCVSWAILKFEDFFNNQIQQLLHNFPVDAVTNSGEPFWSGPKRPPQAIAFDVNDPTQFDFVRTAALLRASNYGLHVDPSPAALRRVCSQVNIPKFVPKQVKIHTDEKEAQNQAQNVDLESTSEQTKQLMGKLPNPSSLAGYKLNPVEFEKDDDDNGHIDFITACSNLRARNYKIPEAERIKVKQIAGRIIPAMVTTTAAVTGLVCLEWYKILNDVNFETIPHDFYKNAFVNLALPFITLSEPIAAPILDYAGTKWTLWDRIDVDAGRELTMSEFINHLKSLKEGMDISMISAGQSIIYSFFAPKDKLQKRLQMPLSEVIKEVSKLSEFPPRQKYISIEICCSIEVDGVENDLDLPTIRYRFRW